MKGLEIIEEGTRESSSQTEITPEIRMDGGLTKSDKAMNMLSDNFGNILQLTGNIIEIRKMKTASEAVLAKMAEDRKRILTEAEAYALKRKVDTSSVVERMNMIRSMMQDFYSNKNERISGDDFCKIITEVVNQMGRVENGIK